MSNFSNTSYTMGYEKAYSFYRSFTANTDLTTVGYMMVGKCTLWDGSDTVPPIYDTEYNRFQTYSDFLGGKRITGNDVYLVIKRINWTTGNVYSAYDDTSNTQFTTGNGMYVYVVTGEVYKCIDNANNAASTVSPTGDYTVNNGFKTTGDGYTWKYMYKVPAASKFLTTSWIPVPTVQNAAYFGHANNTVAGSISRMVVVTPGSGYGTTNTSIVVTGSGVSGNANATVNAAGSLTAATVDVRGVRYTRRDIKANVVGSGTTANVRVILSPYGGHAFNPARELGANTVLISVKIGDVDATEGGNITANNDFRQIGMLLGPHKYGESAAANSVSADLAVTMATRFTLVSGTAYTQDEPVYQGVSLATATFSGYASDVTLTNAIECTGTQGAPVLGTALIGATSGSSRTVITYTNPDLEPETGDLVYTENRAPVVRAPGQGELIKIALRFMLALCFINII